MHPDGRFHVGSSPRMRGTVRGTEATRLIESGSSPRLRGTDDASESESLRSSARFIPAPAGNSWLIPSMSLFGEVTVHPRACGEQILTVEQSPCRFPAYAGNRLKEIQMRLTTAVHPRACGEQRLLSASAFAWSRTVHPRACGEQVTGFDRPSHAQHAGSSPRLRGTGLATQ